MRNEGFTVLELLVTLSIVCLLVFTGVPALSDLSNRSQSRATVINLVGLFSLARQTALSTGELTTICGSSDGLRCDREWSQGVLVFTDGDRMGVVDDDDLVVRYDEVSPHGSLVWRAFQNKPYLQYTYSGRTNYHNGNLTYCPLNGDLKHARKLIVSVTGRVRIAQQDSSGTGNSARQDDAQC